MAELQDCGEEGEQYDEEFNTSANSSEESELTDNVEVAISKQWTLNWPTFGRLIFKEPI